MSLIKCTECGKDFSQYAESCPNCGCPKRIILEKNTADSQIVGKADLKEKAESEEEKDETVENGSTSTNMAAKVEKHSTSKTAIVIITIIILMAIGGGVFFTVFYPDMQKYDAAQALLNQGKLIEAYDAFAIIDTYKDSALIMDKLKSKMYQEAIGYYKEENLIKAIPLFNKLSGYEKSDDYLTLISAKGYDHQDKDSSAYLKVYFSIQQKKNFLDTVKALKAMLDFEDTKQIILSNKWSSYSEGFLEGKWEDDRGNFFSVTNQSGFYDYKFDDKTFETLEGPEWHVQYNMPWYNGEFYKLENGIMYNGDDKSGWKKVYRFTIQNEDQIGVFCFKNNQTYVLRRQ